MSRLLRPTEDTELVRMNSRGRSVLSLYGYGKTQAARARNAFICIVTPTQSGGERLCFFSGERALRALAESILQQLGDQP